LQGRMRIDPTPFALSLSKGRPFLLGGEEEGQGFDKLSPNGVRSARTERDQPETGGERWTTSRGHTDGVKSGQGEKNPAGAPRVPRASRGFGGVSVDLRGPLLPFPHTASGRRRDASRLGRTRDGGDLVGTGRRDPALAWWNGRVAGIHPDARRAGRWRGGACTAPPLRSRRRRPDQEQRRRALHYPIWL